LCDEPNNGFEGDYLKRDSVVIMDIIPKMVGFKVALSYSINRKD